MKYEKIEANGEVAQEVSEDFAFYQEVMRDYAQASPQSQGLTAPEFIDALADPSVISTQVDTVEGSYRLPQLSPVEKNGWLNADFYERRFPEEYKSNDVLYYVDLPSIQPGQEVKSRLTELADSNGVLVYDYPMTDPDYPQRIQAVLNELGIRVEADEELGNQTYFIGQVYLKRVVDRRNEALSFSDAYQKALDEGTYDPARMANGASLLSEIDESRAQDFRSFYEDAYVVLNDHPCEQGLSPDEFKEMLTERQDVAKIVNSIGGEAISLVLLDNNLEKLTWVNADYYKRNYPEKYEDGQIFWFPGLAADPNRPEGQNTQVMVDLIGELAEKGGNYITIAFDCCDMNTGFLDVFLTDMINKGPYGQVDIQPIAVQRYSALRLSKQ